MESFTTPVPQERMCFWYMAGDTNRKPHLALVTDGDEYGLLCLAVFGVNWSQHQCYVGVRHKDDPFLVKRPQHAKDNGCWDYLLGHAPVMAPSMEKKDQEASRYLAPEIKGRLAELAAAGKSAPEIAADLTEFTNEDWSYQRVGAILRSLRKAD